MRAANSKVPVKVISHQNSLPLSSPFPIGKDNSRYDRCAMKT